MARFKPGQEVVCIYRKTWKVISGPDAGKMAPKFGPKFNEIVTVHSYDGYDSIILAEYQQDPFGLNRIPSFFERCFAPILPDSAITSLLEETQLTEKA